MFTAPGSLEERDMTEIRIIVLMSAISSRNAADTPVPITPPNSLKPSNLASSAPTDSATSSDAATTTVEWPNAKNIPTATGRLPSCISLRVTLSIAAMWSGSTAWRSPSV